VRHVRRILFPMNAATKLPAVKTSAPPLKIDGRTRMGRMLKAAKPVNDVSLDALDFVDPCHVAPALPEVREIACPMPDMAPPCDARIVVDVIPSGGRGRFRSLRSKKRRAPLFGVDVRHVRRYLLEQKGGRHEQDEQDPQGERKESPFLD
jgi:hypothetical protein